MGYLVYFNIVRAGSIIKSPYNERMDSYAKTVVRGSITDKDGNVLAKTKTGDTYKEDKREYPYGDVFAHVVGYNTNGKSGLERAENIDLYTSNSFILDKLKNGLQNKRNVGNTVQTTLDTDLQQACYDALGDNKGAVVCIDPKTGGILAMVSKPDFNPSTVLDNWDKLNTSSDSILLNRATNGSYVPGSVFKIATTLEYMRENSNYNAYTYDCTGEIEPKDGPAIHCFDGDVHGKEDLETSFANSCNTSYSNIGSKLNTSKWRKTAEDLLFNKTLPCDLPTTTPKFSLKNNDGQSMHMATAIGQGNTMTNPYHMALIAAAIANDGVLMKPHLVSKIKNDTGSTVKTIKNTEYKTLMTSSEASQLRTYMKAVVSEGTGTVLSGRGYEAAGKTGTAEYSSDKSKDHSWFAGMINPDDSPMAICCIIEGADGNARAVNVVANIFDSYNAELN
ncbi:MAG: penicillin-binding protein 2 [Lachnospiraceae bacterium]|nr:penicillin-binding protein 2 [Lachnospiraceae bacterium]